MAENTRRGLDFVTILGIVKGWHAFHVTLRMTLLDSYTAEYKKISLEHDSGNFVCELFDCIDVMDTIALLDNTTP